MKDVGKLQVLGLTVPLPLSARAGNPCTSFAAVQESGFGTKRT